MPTGFTGRKKKNIIEQLKDIKAEGEKLQSKPKPIATSSKATPPKPKPEPETMREGVIKNEETGELTGIKLPGRDPIVGIPPEEVRFLAEKHRARTETPAGQVDLTGEAREERELRGRAEEVIKAEGMERAGIVAPDLQEQPLQEEPFVPPINIGGKELSSEEYQEGMIAGTVRPIEATDLMASLKGITTASAVGGILIKSNLKNTGKSMIQSVVSKTLASTRNLFASNFIKGVVLASLITPVIGAATGALSGGSTERQGAIATYGQLPATYVESVQNSLMTPSEAIRDLNSIENELDRLEREIKKSWIKRTVLQLTGDINDVNADLIDAKREVLVSKQDIQFIQITEPETVELALYIQKLRRQYGTELVSFEEELAGLI